MIATQTFEVPAYDKAISSNRADRDAALNQARRTTAGLVRAQIGSSPRLTSKFSPSPPAWWLEARARLLTGALEPTVRNGVETFKPLPDPPATASAAKVRAEIDGADDPPAAPPVPAVKGPAVYSGQERRKSAGTARTSGVERRAAQAAHG